MSVRINIGVAYNGRNIKRSWSDLQKLAAKADTTSARLKVLGAQMRLVGQTMSGVGQTMTRKMSMPLAALGGYAVKTAMDFETSFSRIQGLVGVAAEDIGELQDAARRLGPAAGKSANEAAEALFFITSAGIQGAEAVQVLDAALKASAIGLGETKTVADLVTSAVNAYGSATLNATHATDVLTAAVRYGKLEPAELAQSMGQVLPVASAMGVSFDQVGAAFAAMSRTGTDASMAATQLRQILATILNPTTEARKELDKYGLSAEGLRSQLRERGLLSVLQTLTGTLGMNDDAIAQVFGNIRALSGVLDLMGSNAAATEDIFRDMADASGMLNEAFDITAQTAKFQFDQAVADLQGSLIDLGNSLMPVFRDLLDGFQGLIDKFNNLNPKQQDFIVQAGLIAAVAGPVIVVLGSIATAVGTLTIAFAGMTAAMAVATGGLSLLAGLIGYAAFKTATMTDEEKAAADAHRDAEVAARRAALGYDDLARAAEIAAGSHRTAGEEARSSARKHRLLNQAFQDEVQQFEAAADRARQAAAANEEVADSAEAVADAIGGAGGAGPTIVRLSDEMRQALQDINLLAAGMDNGGEFVAQFARELLAAGEITDDTAQAAVRLASVVKQDVDRALADANRRLEEAEQRFTAYRDAIAGGIRQGNTLADAAGAQADALQTLTQAEEDYQAALTSGDPDRISDAARALDRAQSEQGSFLDFLQVGLTTAEGFAGQIDALRLAGASMEVVQQIAELGARTGGRIAAELLAGGAAAIAQANALVAAVDDAARRAGQAAAQQFYGAGVEAARQFVSAVEQSIPALQSILDRIADMIGAALGARPEVRIDGSQTFIPPKPTPAPARPTPKPRPNVIPAGFDPLKYDWAAEKMATGGFVTGPTFAMVGEAGPEVVMPLDWFERRYGGGQPSVVNVTVTSADPQAVVEAIRRYTKQNGPLGGMVAL